ncbi:MAG: GNAT family N-acetyltransferase [FCB group bacterium]|jgi:GNAT superfamily N-acetyltransferase|nr:GNAT family N-acetyltransferase [FCB group bacterium]
MPATFAEALDIVTRVLARDLACSEDGLRQEGVVLTEARELPGRRQFPFHTPSFLMATMGRGTVISCNRERLENVRAIAEGFTAPDLFSTSGLWLFQESVMPDGQLLLGPQVKHICIESSLIRGETAPGYDIKHIDRSGLPMLHALVGFPHAMTRNLDGPRPDEMAMVALHKGEIVGVAGVTGDCDELWQLGIEISPQHQGRGLAKVLVSRLAEILLGLGKIPYYSTELGNIRSSALATSIGFRPAWVEVFTNTERTFVTEE